MKIQLLKSQSIHGLFVWEYARDASLGPNPKHRRCAVISSRQTLFQVSIGGGGGSVCVASGTQMSNRREVLRRGGGAYCSIRLWYSVSEIVWGIDESEQSLTQPTGGGYNVRPVWSTRSRCSLSPDNLLYMSWRRNARRGGHCKERVALQHRRWLNWRLVSITVHIVSFGF